MGRIWRRKSSLYVFTVHRPRATTLRIRRIEARHNFAITFSCLRRGGMCPCLHNLRQKSVITLLVRLFSRKVSAYFVIAFGVDLAEVVFAQIGQANAGGKL